MFLFASLRDKISGEKIRGQTNHVKLNRDKHDIVLFNTNKFLAFVFACRYESLNDRQETNNFLEKSACLKTVVDLK